MKPKQIFTLLLFFIFLTSKAQTEESQSVIQTLTPSKLIAKKQWDIKWFNNLYTQTKSTFTDAAEPRQTFFTSTLEGFTGVSETKRVNLGLILKLRSNVIADRQALDVFKFDGETGTARSGLTSFAPSVKFVPLAMVPNFSLQSSVFIPLVSEEVANGVFLDQNGYIWQNRFFYDHTFQGNTYQLFLELNTELNLGNKEDSFANNSLNLIPGVFFSYFPTPKFTVFGLIQHAQRLDLGNDFGQDFTALGAGVKFQITRKLNIESLYTNFVRGNNTGLGETYNIGLRAVL